MTEIDNKAVAMRVSIVSIIVNVALSIFKLIAGIIGHSGAMLSDAVHSLSDVFSTIVVMIGIHIASKESDSEHQYGHDRLECVAAIFLSIFLFATGGGIGYDAIKTIANKSYIAKEITLLPLFAAIISIAIKEWMFWYTKLAAKKINSSVLLADAWHHRSDAISSVGAFIGILGSRLGYPVSDSIASIIICLFIIRVSLSIFNDATKKMIDTSCDAQTVKEIEEAIFEIDGVIDIDLLQTRLFGAKIYVDVEISADGNLRLFQSHEIAEKVHYHLEEKFPLIKHCMVHVNPSDKIPIKYDK